jgi:hypothetical protein
MQKTTTTTTTTTHTHTETHTHRHTHRHTHTNTYTHTYTHTHTKEWGDSATDYKYILQWKTKTKERNKNMTKGVFHWHFCGDVVLVHESRVAVVLDHNLDLIVVRFQHLCLFFHRLCKAKFKKRLQALVLPLTRKRYMMHCFSRAIDIPYWYKDKMANINGRLLTFQSITSKKKNIVL